MDGTWQTGHKTADEYGRLAAEAARTMRQFDPELELELELVACESSSSKMPTFPQWEVTVLEHCYNDVDYISLHTYFQNHENDLETFLGRSVEMDNFIESVINTCDYVQAKKRSKKKMMLSFDEWNVWYHSTNTDQKIKPWQVAPPLLEDVYNFEDALLVGCMLNSLIRHADRVKIACLAQLVNVIAPIMTENGGAAWRQTIFWPYYFVSNYGRGISLGVANNSPTYENGSVGIVPYIDASGVWNEEDESVVLFFVNRSRDTVDLEVLLGNLGLSTITKYKVLGGYDLLETNTVNKQNSVVPKEGSGLFFENETLSGKLEGLSWNMVILK